MSNNMKREYTAPETEIMNARVERGFEGSTPTDNALANTEGNDSYALGEGIGSRFN